MTRLIVLLVAALLSPISHAKHLPKKIKGDSIHLYQWVSDYCDGTPYGYNANLYMQRDKCVSLEARSVRPRFDAKRKQWLQLVNTGTLQCKLLMWNNPGCVGDYNAIMDVPEDFDKCYTTPEHFPKRSAKFTCGRNIVDGLGVENGTKPTQGIHTLSAISWAIGDGEVVTPVTSTHTVTVQTIRPEPITSTQTVTVVATREARTLEPRGRYHNDFWDLDNPVHKAVKSEPSSGLEPRCRYHDEFWDFNGPVHKVAESDLPTGLDSRSLYDKEHKAQIAHVWMYHPWTRSIICYECFTKVANDWNWVKCYSKREGPNYCGPKPVDVWGNPLTTMKTVVLNGTSRTSVTSVTEPATMVVKTTVFVTVGMGESTAQSEFGLGLPMQTGTSVVESQTTTIESEWTVLATATPTTTEVSNTLQGNTTVFQPKTSVVQTETIILESQMTADQTATSVESEMTVAEPKTTVIEDLPSPPTTQAVLISTVTAQTTVTHFLPPVTITATPAATPLAPASTPLMTTPLETILLTSQATSPTSTPLKTTPVISQETPLPSNPLPSSIPVPSNSAPPRLVPRSWHKSVHFRLPWNNMRMCADAEWESRGKPDTEIRIQKVFVDSGDSCRSAESIDLRV